MKNESLRKKLTGSVWLLIFSIMVIFLICPTQVRAAGKVQMKKTAIQLSKTVYTYNGKVQKPAVTVKYKGKKLKLNKDYTLIYAKGRKIPGAYTVTVKGKGTYQGSVKKTFRINPLGTSIISVHSSFWGTTLEPVWKKQEKGISGYQIRYSERKDWKEAKLQTIRNRGITTVTLKNLKSRTCYYLQVRTFYKDKNGKAYYSAWSKTFSQTTTASLWDIIGKGDDNKKTEKPVFTVGAYEDIKVTLDNVTGQDETFLIYASNDISKVKISNPDVLVQGRKKTKKSRSFIQINPGKTKITFTDIYGQTTVSNVTVEEELYMNNTKKIVKSIKYDTSLVSPEIKNLYYDNSHVTISCSEVASSDTVYTGCEAWLSKSSDFTDCFRRESEAYDQKGDYEKLRFSCYAEEGATYYLKIRTFKLKGSVKLCGAWSTVQKIRIGNVKSKSDAQPKYSYQVYFLDNLGTELYTGGDGRAIYIQTDNPDPGTIKLYSSKGNILSQGMDYDDIAYLNKYDYGESLRKVKGGYLGNLYFNNAGNYNIELQEIQKKGYVVIKNFHWKVQDYEKAKDAWVNRIIADNTNEAMTPFEKMDAVCDYLNTPGFFRYLTNSNGKLVTLASQPNEPFFWAHRWDSYISPYMLCVIANRIGGFDEVHNCYGDYPFGSKEWQKNHYLAKLTVGTETRFYSVCPLSSTGDVGEIKKIDFTDPASLYPAD